MDKAERELERINRQLIFDQAKCMEAVAERGRKEARIKKEKDAQVLVKRYREQVVAEPDFPSDVGDAGAGIKYSDTGEGNKNKRKYPDTGG